MRLRRCARNDIIKDIFAGLLSFFTLGITLDAERPFVRRDAEHRDEDASGLHCV